MKNCVFATLFLTVVIQAAPPTPPKWPDVYQATGVIRLPYAEINEDFVAYYDRTAKKSRVDYYLGAVQTFQRGDEQPYGNQYKVVYYTMDTKNITNGRTCFKAPGSQDGPVTPQTLLPDLSNFTFAGTQQFGNKTLSKWTFTVVNGQKKNQYTMWLNSATGAPHKYEMFGYDSLLGSHYDKYYIDYSGYLTTKPPDSTFDVPKTYTCTGFPGPGDATTANEMNPVSEFFGPDGHPFGQKEHTNIHFENFKRSKIYEAVKGVLITVWYNRKYENDREHSGRYLLFRDNLRFIQSHNRRGLSFRTAVNHLADRNVAELRRLRGRRYSPNVHYNGGLPFDTSKYNVKDLPDQIDWRLYGAVTPVKDQAICGSCWSFGTTGTIEGVYFVETGTLIRLSQQELIDCSWGEGNNGCDGGEDFRAYTWIMRNGGISSADSYSPYMGQDMKCHASSTKKAIQLSGFVNVTHNDTTALRVALANHGPVTVAIDASQRSFSFYSNGIYYDPNCGNKPDQLDHQVLAVGYGQIGKDTYWLIKNSWSTYWGNDGYVLMSPKDNNCGVMTTPTFPVIKK